MFYLIGIMIKKYIYKSILYEKNVCFDDYFLMKKALI